MKTIFLYLMLLGSIKFPMLNGQTIVNQYVSKTQKHRKSTRFTILEWLKIKRQIKEMDLWLAVFSNPTIDKFRPEFRLDYGMKFNSLNKESIGVVGNSSNKYSLVSEEIKATFFLTNLVTSTFKTNLLNIDIGIEGIIINSRNEPKFSKIFSKGSSQNINPFSIEESRQGVLFRILGKHIQDTSLVLKVGQVQQNMKWTQNFPDSLDSNHSGTYNEIDGKIYFASFFGVFGSKRLDKIKTEELEVQIIKDEYGFLIDFGAFGLLAGKSSTNQQNLPGEGNSYHLHKSSGQFVGLNFSL